MICYLCESKKFLYRHGEVRDAPTLKILECKNCGLVMLDDKEHITSDFYRNSGMHGTDPRSIESWLKQSSKDDHRRFNMLKSGIENKKVLDFGCGAGGFLSLSKNLASEVAGVELESRIQSHWAGQINIFPKIEDVMGDYDLITSFHVFEHLINPREVLSDLARHLTLGGLIVLEVPNANDALISLYNNEAFQKFTYWSQHLFLFTSPTLEILARQAGLKVVMLKQYQRYPLSNHLYWLSKGVPGGHQKWLFLDTPELTNAYSHALSSMGKADTLIAHLEQI